MRDENFAVTGIMLDSGDYVVAYDGQTKYDPPVPSI